MALAHQPVMDMAPRWAGGYGFQLRMESLTRNDLEKDGIPLENPLGLKSESLITWMEGIYTFRRGLRMTFKLPYIDRETRVLKGGQLVEQNVSGLGDLILGFPLKRYFNYPNYSGNIAITPSFRLPAGSTSPTSRLGRGTVDYNLSASVSVEMFKLYTYLDLFSWFNTEGSDGVRKGNLIGFDLDLGVHPYHNYLCNLGSFLMVGFSGRHEFKDKLSTEELVPNSGELRLEVIPTFVLYWNNWMWRTQYHIPIYQRLNGTQLADSFKFQTGIGLTFKSFSPM